ncbi:MAG: type II secretion system protein [Verrucomicrobiota bacterium]
MIQIKHNRYRICIELKNSTLSRRQGFTLIELLVTVTIVLILLGLAVIGGQKALETAKRTTEVNAARQLTQAYLLTAEDNNGVLMPAHQFGAVVEFPDGGVAGGPEASRYPWRLAPYLNWDVEKTMMINDASKGLDGLEQGSTSYRYAVSLAPALGINAYCVGGYYSMTKLFSPNDVTTRLLQSSRDLVLFTSARTSSGAVDLSGSWFVRPPRMGPMAWKSGDYDPSVPSLQYGNVDFRYNGKAVVSMTDGSVRLMSIDELRNMKLWARNADTADYAIGL